MMLKFFCVYLPDAYIFLIFKALKFVNLAFPFFSPEDGLHNNECLFPQLRVPAKSCASL